ncbi:MAG: hypothetical protein R3B45_07910 [Bdellovibrionota bacterium]
MQDLKSFASFQVYIKLAIISCFANLIEACSWSFRYLTSDEYILSTIIKAEPADCNDARMIKPGSMHGIARYVFQLLHQIKDLRSDYTFTALVNPGSPLKKSLGLHILNCLK